MLEDPVVVGPLNVITLLLEVVPSGAVDLEGVAVVTVVPPLPPPEPPLPEPPSVEH